MVIIDGLPLVGKVPVLAKDTGFVIDDSVVHCRRCHDNLERRSRLVHVGDGAVAHLILFGLVG